MKIVLSPKSFGNSSVSLALSLAAAVSLTAHPAWSDETESSKQPAQSSGTGDPALSPATGAAVVEKPPVRPSEWRFQNEQEWIVDSIGRDVAEILGYAKYGKDPKSSFSASDVDFTTRTVSLSTNSYAYKVGYKNSDSALEYKFALDDYAWSPKNYEPFAKQLMTALKLTASAPSAIPEDFLKNVSKAEFSSLFAENKRISKALSENPLDASLHEQAALLQATFNMLEICGIFSDTRAPLDRMSAHLSLARALNQDKLSTVGQIANIALESMSCRDGVAVALIEEAEKQQLSPIEKSFLRAIKIRSTSNYRIFDESEQTPIEENQYALRYAQSRGIQEAMEMIAKRHPQLSIQWMRILASGPASVQTGHVIQARMVSAEIVDFMKNRNAYKETSNDNFASFVDELNLPSTRCLSASGENPRLNVLSWGDIAAFSSRHIANAIADEYLFNSRMYSVKELADRTKASAEKVFANLNIMPLVEARFNLEGQEKDKFLADLQKLLINHPELMTSDNWSTVVDNAKKVAPQTVLLPPELWFDPPMPMGTVFYFRNELKNCKKNLAELSEWKRLCPYSPMLCLAWAEKKYGPHPNAEQLREAFGPMADFDVHAMGYIAGAEVDHPEKFIPLAEKIAKEDPSYWLYLGEYCVKNGKPDQAAAYYEKGVKEVEDAVHVSNECDWLVRYRFDHGQKDQALQLAQSAAEVYSARGLITLAGYYERMGKLKEAEDYYRKVVERYDSKEPLAAFYIRNSAKDKRYEQQALALTKELFPNGMKHVTLASFADKPAVGVEITHEDWLTGKSPLQYGTVIVGLNGYAVSNKSQYDTARFLATKPSAWVIFWNGKEYKETSRPVVNHGLIGISIQNFESPEAKAKRAAEQKPAVDALTKLKDNMMKQAAELQKQNLPPEEMLKRLFQQNNIPPSVYQNMMKNGAPPVKTPGHSPSRPAGKKSN